MTVHDEVDVAVVGDGLIGLSTAFHLLDRGLSVAVLGTGAPGRASTAAAGMLTPACEYDPWMCHEFLELLQLGLADYPRFIKSLDVPAESVGYRPTDFTLVDLKEREPFLRERMEWMPGLGFDCTWLEPDQVSREEPNISPAAVRGGIRIRGEGVVNPIALWDHLDGAVTAGGALRRRGLSGAEDLSDRLELRCEDGAAVVAERVVVASGAWSCDVAALLGLEVPVCPVKGQMVLLSGDPGLVRSVVFMPSGGCGSVVERAPGSYVVGTSEEYLSPHEQNTAGVIGAVLSRLTEVLPVARGWRIERMWSGFRPMTSDELPVLGVSDDPRIVIAAGHHRNGILLTPVTGRIVADLVSDVTTPDAPDLTPFRPGRPLRPFARFADKY